MAVSPELAMALTPTAKIGRHSTLALCQSHSETIVIGKETDIYVWVAIYNMLPP